MTPLLAAAEVHGGQIVKISTILFGILVGVAFIVAMVVLICFLVFRCKKTRLTTCPHCGKALPG